jgi:hypothetical protein
MGPREREIEALQAPIAEEAGSLRHPDITQKTHALDGGGALLGRG